MAEGAPRSKRQRLTETGSWPSWGSGLKESEIEGVGKDKAKLKLKAKVVDATNLEAAKDEAVIATGIAYLDHMVDQLTAHAQLRVSLQVSYGEKTLEPHSNEAAKLEIDGKVVELAGATLGGAISEMLKSRSLSSASKQVFRFCAPLDEAFSDLTLDFSADSSSTQIQLAPYGCFPKKGREFIGSFRTALVENFFVQLSKALGCSLKVRKCRGDNAHHIVEATFKSFARCLRQAMDAFCSFDIHGSCTELNYRRRSHKQRSTKETSIDVLVDLDEKGSPSAMSTGISTLDEILSAIQTQSGVHMKVSCSGDLWIDDHHSAEDVTITIGKALNDSLGSKAGINRMGYASADYGAASILCVMDLSNRPCLISDLRLDACDEEMVGDLSVEMIQHCFESLVMNSLISVHFFQLEDKANEKAPGAKDVSLAAAKAFGLALKQCAAVDPRRAGATASSKGTLSK
eukprot:TRINITY_DN5245_c0_g2_i1.p1 TRINITY_DN5245_c0_g2~~TRINITY_DN5245_c0_g2_i1.p1  ORF type:complete len:471 (-),score=97.13 TRINITY_DN5245_c0_g2_i1:199-1575(-)